MKTESSHDPHLHKALELRAYQQRIFALPRSNQIILPVGCGKTDSQDRITNNIAAWRRKLGGLPHNSLWARMKHPRRAPEVQVDPMPWGEVVVSIGWIVAAHFFAYVVWFLAVQFQILTHR